MAKILRVRSGLWWQRDVRKLAEAFVYTSALQGLSKKEFAERANLCASTVYNLAKGETVDPRISTVMKLARALGCELKITGNRRVESELRRQHG